MKDNWKIAWGIYGALKQAGVELGNASVPIIGKVLDEYIKPPVEGKERIEITKEACAALRSFLMNEREGTGEGYSDFIFKAIELRREQAENRER